MPVVKITQLNPDVRHDNEFGFGVVVNHEYTSWHELPINSKHGWGWSELYAKAL